MEEAEWSVSTNPWKMLSFLERRASPRKLQLFAAACCRRAFPLSTDSRHRAATEAAERAADGDLSPEAFERALQPVVELWANIPNRLEARWEPHHYMTAATRHLNGGGGAEYAANFAARGLACLNGEEESPPWLAARVAEGAHQCSMLRDIFGSPFRPFQFDSAWLSGQGGPAVALARRIEQTGRFDDVPLLAETLAQVGCSDPSVLDHCRTHVPHVRGCWVLDALLGREPAVYTGLMSASDWRTCQDPTSLLYFLRDKGTERQWRRFAVACCKRIDRFITDDRSRRAVEVAERYAEGTATDKELEEARTAAQEAQEEAKRTEWKTEAEENFCITLRYAAVSRDLFAAQAARSTVCRDPRMTDAAPDTYEAEFWAPSHDRAVAAARWNVYSSLANEKAEPEPDSLDAFLDSALMTEHGKLSSGRPHPSVEAAAERVTRAELRAQCELLHDIFGEFLGPPGTKAPGFLVGGLLPCRSGGVVFPLGEARPFSQRRGTMPRLDVLPCPLPYGPAAEPLSETGGETHRNAYVARFTDSRGDRWVAKIQSGLRDVHAVCVHPDGRRARVISGGQDCFGRRPQRRTVWWIAYRFRSEAI